MRYSTEDWEPLILNALPHLDDGVERLSALRELVWRRELQLDPLSELPELVDKVVEVLEEVDCEQRLVGGRRRTDLEWEGLRGQWRALAAALLTASRQAFDSEKFEHWIEKLAPFLDEDPELAERVRHERCLWSLNQHDFERLEALVDEWQPQSSDPAWSLRKAALLMELGRREAARELGLGVLETVRKWPSDTANFAGPSREAWALSLVAATYGYQGDVAARRRELQSRFRELAPYRCDPRAEFSSHERAVSLHGQDREYRPFDLGVRNVKGMGFSKVANLRALAAFRVVRFTEVVGSPSVVCGDLLVRSGEALLPYRPQWSSVLSIGLANEDVKRRFSRTLSRWRIACMAPELAASLAEAQHRTIGFALERLGRKKDTDRGWWVWRHRLEAAIEALSRFVLRLAPAEVERVLVLAQDLYRDSRVRSDLFLLGAMSNLLSRAWESLPSSLKTRHALGLLRLPIPEVDGFEVDAPDHLVDPGHTLDAHRRSFRSPQRTGAKERQWAEVVRLVSQGLLTGGTARKRAALRLAVMAEWGGLTNDEQQRLGHALWTFGVDDKGLPRDTNLSSWVFPRLPEPERGLAEKCLRASWFSAGGWEKEGSKSLEAVLRDAGAVQGPRPNCEREIELTKTERASLVCAVARWAAVGPTTVLPWEGREQVQLLRRTFRSISNLLLELPIGPETAELLLGHVQSLATTKTPAYDLLPGIVKSDPQKADDAAVLLRLGLGGSTPSQRPQIGSACGGLYCWLRASVRSSSIPAPPADLVFELGVIISAHRLPSLPDALEVAEWVFDDGADEHRSQLASPCLQGLAFLRQALAFREEEPNSHPFIDRADVVSEDEVDVPWLRHRCFGLAAAMNRAGFGEEAAVAGWLKDAESDPLPELRLAAEELQSCRGG